MSMAKQKHEKFSNYKNNNKKVSNYTNSKFVLTQYFIIDIKYFAMICLFCHWKISY